MLKKVYFILSLSLIASGGMAQEVKNHWVDSVFQRMTLPEKIGQLFMLPVSSLSTREEMDALFSKVKNYQPGSLLITRGGPKSLVSMNNRLQQMSKVPLLLGLNAEWGLGQTLDSTMSFQPALVQSALPGDSIQYQLGQLIAAQMKMVGVHINFAPRIDVLANQADYANYYSNSKQRVADKSAAFVRGLQENGVLACAKQSSEKASAFSADSTGFYEFGKLDTLEFYTHLRLIRETVGGMLTNHFNFSVHEATGRKKEVPASMSPIFINEILKDKLGFQGLTFTHVPYLQSLAPKKKGGEIETLAFLIGNDILIDPQNLSAAVKKMKKAIKKNPALLVQLNGSVKKILGAKFDTGLATRRLLNSGNLMLRLHTPEAQLFRHRLAEAAVTVVRNDTGLIPIKMLENKHFISLFLAQEEQPEFNHYLSQYAPAKIFQVRSLSDTVGLETRLLENDVILIGVFPSASGFQKNLVPLIKKLVPKKEVIVCHFGNPQELRDWDGMPTLLECYVDQGLMPKVAAEIIFGGMSARGVLPANVSDSLPAGFGLTTSTQDRLSYTLPEAAGINSLTLDKIARIAQEAIDLKATPGCRVLIAKDGKVVYDRSFGWFTYDKKTPVTDETLYDLASLTKVSATLQTVMFMQERGLIDINKKASVYLPELRESNKKDFILKDILTHQAGLWPFLPFWSQTMKDSLYMPEFYSEHESPEYPYPVAKNLFAARSMRDSLWQWILHAKIVEKPNRIPYNYRYSDMAFYIMQHLAEKLLNQPMEDFLEQNIYEPIGAYTTGFLPLRKFPENRIAPTEDDKLFRKSLLTGYVHDQGAAMYGGIAGHAGLFSTANDLAKLGQMWLQGGRYGGHQFFKPQTLQLFTQKQYENSHRGLGWDKPAQSDPDGPTSIYASQKTFGHTGFTGTCIWVDPEFNLVYVFLSNRVNPSMTNNKILNANIRPRIQEVIYKAIFTYCEDHN